MRGLVGGRVAQHHERLEVHQRIERLAALHLLRLIEDQDGSIGRDHVDGAAGLEVVQLLVDAPGVLAGGIERLHVDHHHVDTGVRREALQMVQLLGVVDEEARLLLVGLQEVLGRDRQRLGHPFADGDARHDDDELAPAMPLVQLENRLDVAVGLAGARLHFDVQVHRGDLGLHQPIRDGQVLVPLHLLQVLQQLPLRQLDLGVLEAVGEQVFGAALACAGIDAVAHGLGGGRWLAGKAAHHGLHGGRLIGLGLELELHWGRGPLCAAFLLSICRACTAESAKLLILGGSRAAGNSRAALLFLQVGASLRSAWPPQVALWSLKRRLDSTTPTRPMAAGPPLWAGQLTVAASTPAERAFRLRGYGSCSAVAPASWPRQPGPRNTCRYRGC